MRGLLELVILAIAAILWNERSEQAAAFHNMSHELQETQIELSGYKNKPAPKCPPIEPCVATIKPADIVQVNETCDPCPYCETE